MPEPHRSDRVGRRVRPRIAIGLVVGPAAGGLIGLLVGLVWFGAGTRGMWAAVIVGLIFGALGAFWAGLGALGPPARADDPLPREDD
jgi:hypothetical protein